METTAQRDWWMLGLRGVLAVAVGVFLLFFQARVFELMVVVFGVFALVAGVMALAAGARRLGHGERGVALVAEGVAGVVAGLLALVWPQLTALTLLYIVGAWAMAIGVLQLGEALEIGRHRSLKWMLLSLGAFALLFGLAIVLTPQASAAGLSGLLGVFVLGFGMLQLAFAAELHRPAAQQQQ